MVKKKDLYEALKKEMEAKAASKVASRKLSRHFDKLAKGISSEEVKAQKKTVRQMEEEDRLRGIEARGKEGG